MIQKQQILFFVILLLVVCSRMAYLDKGYNSDEGWLLRTSSHKLNRLIPALKEGRSVYPPLSVFLLHFWMRLSQREEWIRLYFVIFGIALCLLLYSIGKLLLDERFGLLLFFLSALSPLLIWSSQFIRSYIDAAFWSTLSVYFMLRMIKGRNSWENSAGYAISCALALYTSYITFLIIVSQNIFILISHFKNLRFLMRWFILQVLIAAIFIPCLRLISQQQVLATGIDMQWGERGFQLFGLNIGHYARSIMASFGIDLYFLAPSFFKEQLNTAILIGIAVFLFFLATLYLFRYFTNIKKFIKESQLIWVFPVLFASSLIIYDFLSEVKGFPILSRYFLQQHILFIFIIAGSVYPVKRANWLNTFMLVIISSIFILSFPGAVKPEFETKKAHHYLENKVKATDCLLLLRNTNYYLEPKRFNALILSNYLQKQSDAAPYNELGQAAGKALLDMKNKYKNVWFYRNYGNDEILGGNNLIMNWLKENGYVVNGIRKFRRVDIIRYQRMD